MIEHNIALPNDEGECVVTIDQQNACVVFLLDQRSMSSHHQSIVEYVDHAGDDFRVLLAAAQGALDAVADARFGGERHQQYELAANLRVTRSYRKMYMRVMYMLM